MIGDLFLEFALLGAEWVLWLLILLSIVSVAVMVERWRFYRARRIDLDALSKAARLAIDKGKDLDSDHADNPSLPAQVAVAAVKTAEQGPDVAGEAMNRAKARGRRQYERLHPILGTLGSNAPFIGLFGTVLGIVGAFNKLKENPEGGIDVVGGDLAEALVATAMGILVAVPAVIAYNLFNRRMRTVLASTDEIAHDLLSAIHAKAKDQ